LGQRGVAYQRRIGRRCGLERLQDAAEAARSGVHLGREKKGAEILLHGRKAEGKGETSPSVTSATTLKNSNQRGISGSLTSPSSAEESFWAAR